MLISPANDLPNPDLTCGLASYTNGCIAGINVSFICVSVNYVAILHEDINDADLTSGSVSDNILI